MTLPGIVERIISPPSRYSDEPEKAEIAVEGADPLCKEIRVENKLHDQEGKEAGLKPGAHVEVTIEADLQEATPKKPPLDADSEQPGKKCQKLSKFRHCRFWLPLHWEYRMSCT